MKIYSSNSTKKMQKVSERWYIGLGFKTINKWAPIKKYNNDKNPQKKACAHSPKKKGLYIQINLCTKYQIKNDP